MLERGTRGGRKRALRKVAGRHWTERRLELGKGKEERMGESPVPSCRNREEQGTGVHTLSKQVKSTVASLPQLNGEHNPWK